MSLFLGSVPRTASCVSRGSVGLSLSSRTFGIIKIVSLTSSRELRHVRLAAAPTVAKRQSIDEDFSALSRKPEIVALFNEAQTNLMALNESRLNALEELKAANQRIAELEGKLDPDDDEEEDEEEDEAAETLPETVKTGSTATSDSFVTESEAVIAPDTMEPAETGAMQTDSGSTIYLEYATGWPATFFHYSADSQGWTELPGLKMEPTDGIQSITVAASSVEFVLTNGENDWDTPDPYSGGNQNYKIEAPGKYRLKNGKIEKLDS